MIKKVRIKNFKCYGPQGVDFNLSKINFIFGDNSAGKSTFLQFLDKIYDVCNLEGKCDGKKLDKYLFRRQGGAISAKLRVLMEGTNEEVWSFAKSDSGSEEYQLTDSKDSFVGLDQLRRVLPARKPVVHVVANRKSAVNKVTDDESELMRFQKDAERLVSEENLSSEQEGVNDILKRLGIPYSCVVATSEGVDSVSREMIHDNDFDIDIRLGEVGTGIEGLVELAMTLNVWEGGLLALEEPETNVNEGQMAALAKVLVEEAKKRESGQLIVECHSKIMALQLVEMVRNRLLVCGTGSESNLSVLVVRKSVDGTRIDEVKIDQNGDVDWPMGFFPAEGKLLRESYGIS